MNASEFPKFSALDVVYAPHWLAQITLPVSKVYGTEFRSINGDYRLTMSAPSEYGLPYGSYPRLLIIYMATMAKLAKRREIPFDSSQAALLKSLGKSSSGGKGSPIRILKEQAMRLFVTSMLYEKLSEGEWVWEQYPLSDKGVMMWDPRINQYSWQSKVVLSECFYKQIKKRAFPLKRQTLLKLSSSPSQIDVYLWLTRRAMSLKDRTFIPWETLHHQFGGNISKRFHFKQCFKRTILGVLDLYPEPKIFYTDSGISLLPFKPDVPAVFDCG